MHSIILTELGIAVFENQKCLKAFPFSNKVDDYLLIKSCNGGVSELVNFISKQDIVTETNSDSLFSVLKQNSIDIQLMNDNEIEKIQVSKPKILID